MHLYTMSSKENVRNVSAIFPPLAQHDSGIREARSVEISMTAYQDTQALQHAPIHISFTSSDNAGDFEPQISFYLVEELIS